MNRLSVIIVDDEPIARDILELYCGKIPGILLVATCANAFEATEILQRERIDLMFLDINMPELSGMQFLKSLNQPPEVIFTTAYSEYAVESYELNALDYLVKPIHFDRFFTAIHKSSKLKRPDLPDTAKSGDTSIFVKSEGKLVRFHPNDLLYVEGLKDYVKFCLEDRKIIVHGTLKKSEEYLMNTTDIFIRVHKSYIINTSRIKEIASSEIVLTSRNGDISIPFGQTYAEELEKRIAGKRY